MNKTHYKADMRYHRSSGGGPSRRSARQTEDLLYRMSPNLAQLTPELRKRVYEEVLDDNRVFLCNHLDPTRHCTYLRSKRHFDRTVQEQINQHATTHDKVNRFIDEVQKKGPNACTAFLESLMNSPEQFVLSRLLEAYETYPYQDLFSDLPAPLDPDPGPDHGPGPGPGGYEGDLNSHDEDPRFSDQFDSFSSSEGASAATVADSSTPLVLPTINYHRLLQCEGRLDDDRIGRLEPEEGSDSSSIDCLTSHSK